MNGKREYEMTKKLAAFFLILVLTLSLGSGAAFATGDILGEGDITPGILEEGDIVPGIIEDGTVTEGPGISDPVAPEDPEIPEETEPPVSEDPDPMIPSGDRPEPEHIDDKWIRIGLQYGASAVSSCTVSADSDLWIGSYTTTYGLVHEECLQNTSVTAVVSNGYIRLQGNQVSMSVERTSFYIMPTDLTQLITINGKKYRGGVLLQMYNGQINVINCLSVHDYLYGVIHNELSQSHPLEALKAQAVAARSFAAMEMGKHSALGFDLCASTDCQMYRGYSSEYPKTCQAVDETEGLVIKYAGKTVSAYYHASSGGHTVNAADVWTKNLGYIVGKEDPYSPNNSWTITMPMSTIQSKLEAAGHYVGTLQSVSISARGAGDCVTAMDFVGTSGRVTIKKTSVRTLLGGTSIRSQLFTISGETSGTPAPAPVPEQPAFNWRTDLPIAGLHVLANAETQLFGSTTIEVPTVKIPEPEIVPEVNTSVVTGSSVTFTGSGNGHGVGMSQLGAVEMAKQGYTFEDILKFYYTGVTVEYAY